MRRAGWAVALATVSTTALAVSLGFWQLDRAAQKTARHDALVARAALPPLAAADLSRTPGAAAEAQQYRRAVVAGRWLAERTVFLENRQMDGRTGFVVVTPLALDDSPAVLLVQRGFAPRRFDDRAALPRVETAAGPVRVEGLLALSPSRLYEFAAAGSGPIRQNLDLADYARETGLALLPVTLQQQGGAGPAADALSRRWPEPAADVQKHYGYAFQWFMIGAAIVCLHVWFRIVQPRRRARR